MSARVCAVLVMVCVLSHLAMAQSAATSGSPLVTAVAVIMAALCLPCAGQLWRHPGAAVWRMTAVMAVAMLVLHPLLRLAETSHAHGDGLVTSSGNGAAALLVLIAGGMVLRGAGRAAGDAKGTLWAYDGSSH